jgi:REP element-mobilizing transposase RayT
MPRRARIEVEGGLYHVIIRGNNRQQIFSCSADYEKFLSLLAIQKRRLPFFLYAYCLIINHVHLLIERRTDAIGRIMQRVLTGYTLYYNRRYGRVGHLLQGRHKSILCQSDRYLAELVRYIHLNPVRAKLVKYPEQYRYSGHRAYLGLEAPGIVDVDPVLRHFGATKRIAIEAYRQFVAAGTKPGYRELFHLPNEAILGTDEFVDATIHPIGEAPRAILGRDQNADADEFNAEALSKAVEEVCRISRQEFFGSSKGRSAVEAKELFVLVGRQVGASAKILAEVTRMSASAVSRRYDAARQKIKTDEEMRKLADSIQQRYRQKCDH